MAGGASSPSAVPPVTEAGARPRSLGAERFAADEGARRGPRQGGVLVCAAFQSACAAAVLLLRG